MKTKEAVHTGFDEVLEARGVSRRTFLKFCGAVAASIGLAETAAPKVAHAIEDATSGGAMLPVVWLEQGSCTGCTESFAQVQTPDVGQIVLEMLSVNYSETLSAGAGWSLEEAKEQTIEAGGYLLVVEGSIMEGWDGQALRIAEEKGTDIVAHAAEHAAAVLAIGSCAVDGGWTAAGPNPAGATGVMQLLSKRGITTPVINLPTCPVNPEWVVAIVVDYLMLDRLPDLDENGFPTLIFGGTIHDNCPRRGHFENGEFVYRFGTVEETKEYCLYALGCKGPQAYSNCPVTRWNEGASWCVMSGAPCAGCCTANPMQPGRNWVNENAPFLKRHHVIKIGDYGIQPAHLGAGVAGVLAVCLVAHGFGMKAAGRVPHGAPYEHYRAWDKKHPEKALYPKTLEMGDVDLEVVPAKPEGERLYEADSKNPTFFKRKKKTDSNTAKGGDE